MRTDRVKGFMFADFWGRTHSVKSVHLGDSLVWPFITDIMLHYAEMSAGDFSMDFASDFFISEQSSTEEAAYIFASGSNHAWVTASVNGETVTLTPKLISGEGFYLEGNEIHAKSRGIIDGDVRSCKVEVYYDDILVKRLDVYQQENHAIPETWSLLNAEIAIAFAPDVFDGSKNIVPCYTEDIDVFGNLTRYWKQQYTSEEWENGTDHNHANEFKLYHYDKYGTLIYDGDFPEVGSQYINAHLDTNKHSLEQRDVRFFGLYGRYHSDDIILTQEADRLVVKPNSERKESIVVRPYESGTIIWTAGECENTFNPVADYLVAKDYIWHSDEVYDHTERLTESDFNVKLEFTEHTTGIPTSSRFKIVGKTIKHESMTNHETTDYIAVRGVYEYNGIKFYSEGDDIYKDSVVNSKSIKTPAFDTTTDFRFALDSHDASYKGERIAVSPLRTYDHTDAVYIYTSLYEEGGEVHKNLFDYTVVPTMSVSSPSGAPKASAEGLYIVMPSNYKNTLSYGDYYASGEWVDPATKKKWSYNDVLEILLASEPYVDRDKRSQFSITMDTDGFTSAGKFTLEFMPTAMYYLEKTRAWETSGTEVLSGRWMDESEKVVITKEVGTSSRFSLAADNRTLTHESMGTDVTTDYAHFKGSYTYTDDYGSKHTISDTWDFDVTNTRTEKISAKVFGDPTIYTDTQNWYASITSNQYSSSSSRCPAKGGSATLIINASHEERTRTETPWSRTITYSWTSGVSQTDAYDSGIDKTYTDWATKTDTPTITGSADGFTRNGSVVTIASEGTTTYDSGRYVTYTAKNNTASSSVTLYQAKNVIEVTRNAYTTTTGFAFGVNQTSVGPQEEYVTINTYTRTYSSTTEYKEWSSGSHTGGVTTTGLTSNTPPSSISCEGATIDGLSVVIPMNAYNEKSRTFTIKASLDGKAGADKTVTQDADSYTVKEAVKAGSYTVTDIELEGGSVTAAGGNATYYASAYHLASVTYKWASGAADTYGKDKTIADDVKWTFASGYVKDVWGFNTALNSSQTTENPVTLYHRNMGKNATTDSCKLRATNASDTSVYKETSVISVTNTKDSGTVGSKKYGTTTYTTQYQNYAVAISANRYTSTTSSCPASGGTVTLTYSASHEERTRTNKPYTRDITYTWTSGAKQTDAYDSGTDYSYGDWSTKDDTPTVGISGTGFSLADKTVTIASEGTTEYKNGRYGIVSASNNGVTKTVTLYQQANTKTVKDVTVYDSITPTISTTNFLNGGGTATLSANAGYHIRKDYTWTSTASGVESEEPKNERSESVVATWSSNVSWLTISDTTLTCAFNTGAERSGTVTAEFAGLSNGVTISQAAKLMMISITARKNTTNNRCVVRYIGDNVGSISLTNIVVGVYSDSACTSLLYNISIPSITLSYNMSVDSGQNFLRSTNTVWSKIISADYPVGYEVTFPVSENKSSGTLEPVLQ